MNGFNKLPTTLYDCWVPVIATMTDLELEYVGLVNPIRNGDEERPDYTQLSRVKINIDRMIDIYEKGFNVRIVNKYDIPVIYHSLDNYVQCIDIDNPNFRSLNRPRDVDPRLPTIKRFMVAIMEAHQMPILKYNIGNDRSGFDLGYSGLKDVVRVNQPSMSNVTPISSRKRIGGRVIDNDYRADPTKVALATQDNISLLNDSLKIDLSNFNLKDYKKRMI